MIDVEHEISAVRREVGSRVLEAGEARVVRIGRTYDTSLEDLWEACTSAERIARWFLPVSGELRVGGRFRLEGNADGTIERCYPPHSFAATWEFAGQVSWIELQLTAESAERTRFVLEHVAHVDQHWEEFGPGAVGVGWELGLMGLALYLAAQGAAVDRAEVAAWSASEGGRSFVTHSSEGWYDASVAGGTDAAAARAAADRTTAAYLGAPAQEPPAA